MAPRIIYQSSATATGNGFTWTIIQDPIFSGNLNLVRFRRSNGQRELLNQIAEWDPHANNWRFTRWTPKPPAVPQWLISWVVINMRGQA